MAKVDIKRLDSVTANDTTATSLINENFKAIQDAIENTLSRDGSTPNFMDADLDLNSYKIINSGEAVDDNDVVTVKYIKETVGYAAEDAANAAASAAQAASSAQSALVSSSNAIAAVRSAETTLTQVNELLSDTQNYVDEAKIEINSVKDSAVQEITDVKNSSKTEIDATVAQGKTDIYQYVINAEGEVKQIAREEANKAIEDAAAQATAIATANMQPLVDEAANSASSAEASMNAAKTSQNNAKTSETSALASKNAAANSAQLAKDWANKLGSTVDGSEYSAKKYAQDAATSASLAQIENKISNCITKIPQDIKLELNNGTLTLKAGSKVYVPNGNNADGSLKFDVVTIEQDINEQTANTSLVYAYHPTYGIGASSKAICFSGSTAPSNPANNTYWYDTTNNKVKRYLSSSSIWREGYSLPICISSNTSIDQIFNGFGYIGSTVFALPGIEGLIPNGRNTEGSLNNIKFTTANVLTVNNTLINDIYMIRLGSTVIQTGNLIYDLDTNYNYNNSISPENKRNFAISGIFTSDSTGRITSFNPKQPIKLPDEQDVALLARNNLYTGNNHYKKRLIIPAQGEAVLLQKLFNASQDVAPSSNEIGYIILNSSTNYSAGHDGVNCFIVGQRDSNGGIHIQAIARKYVDGVEKTSSIRATVLNTGIRACYATTPQENNGTIIVHNNDDSIVTSKWFNQKVQVVSTLPASPDANVYYFIPE